MQQVPLVSGEPHWLHSHLWDALSFGIVLGLRRCQNAYLPLYASLPLPQQGCSPLTGCDAVQTSSQFLLHSPCITCTKTGTALHPDCFWMEMINSFGPWYKVLVQLLFLPKRQWMEV